MIWFPGAKCSIKKIFNFCYNLAIHYVVRLSDVVGNVVKVRSNKEGSNPERRQKEKISNPEWRQKEKRQNPAWIQRDKIQKVTSCTGHSLWILYGTA